MNDNTRKCMYCGEELSGRSDKKYCDNHCKSAYHYTKNSGGQGNFYYMIDKQLKRNRTLLKQYNKAGKATVRMKSLVEKGFNPKIFTHYWKNSKGGYFGRAEKVRSASISTWQSEDILPYFELKPRKKAMCFWLT